VGQKAARENRKEKNTLELGDRSSFTGLTKTPKKQKKKTKTPQEKKNGEKT